MKAVGGILRSGSGVVLDPCIPTSMNGFPIHRYAPATASAPKPTPVMACGRDGAVTPQNHMKSSLMKASVVSLAIVAIILPVAVSCGGGNDKSSNDSSKLPPGSGEIIITEGTATPVPKPTLAPRTGDFASLCQKSPAKGFSAPTTVIDPTRAYTAVIKTAKGDITIELNPQAAPVTVNSFVFLACSGFYDGVTFHRVIAGFVAQGGDPQGTGHGGPGYTLPDEFGSLQFTRGHTRDGEDAAPRTAAAASSSSATTFRRNRGGAERQIHDLRQGDRRNGRRQSVDAARPATNPNLPPGDAILGITVTEY